MKTIDKRLRLELESFDVLLKIKLWMQIVIAMVSGLTLGLMLSPEGAAIGLGYSHIGRE